MIDKLLEYENLVKKCMKLKGFVIYLICRSRVRPEPDYPAGNRNGTGTGFSFKNSGSG